MKNEQWYKVAEKILIRDEGLRLSPYKDSKNFWTYGVGRFIGKKLESLKISKETAVQMLREDIDEAYDGACILFGDEFLSSLSPARQHAIISLLFNMGLGTFSQFKNTIRFLKVKEWDAASENLLQSLWARQVKQRSERIAFMIRTGEYHEEYTI